MNNVRVNSWTELIHALSDFKDTSSEAQVGFRLPWCSG